MGILIIVGLKYLVFPRAAGWAYVTVLMLQACPLKSFDLILSVARWSPRSLFFAFASFTFWVYRVVEVRRC